MLMLFASLLAIPLALSIMASASDFKHYVDAVLASVLLCIIWAFVTVCAHLLPFPQSKQYHMLVDLIALSLCVTAFMTQFQWWKLTLAGLFGLQLWAHVWFRGHWDPAAPDVSIGRTYILALNVLWLAQLLCVSVPGGRHVVLSGLARLRAGGNASDLARR